MPSPAIPYLGLFTGNGRELDDSLEASSDCDSLNFLGFAVPERTRPPDPETRPLFLPPPVLHLAIICNGVEHTCIGVRAKDMQHDMALLDGARFCGRPSARLSCDGVSVVLPATTVVACCVRYFDT